MVDFKDYYKILGVAKGADEKEIKAAYRKLARKHHPDVNPGNKQAEAKFKEINEAYEVLSDPQKRQRYEQLGSDWSSYATRGGPSAWEAAQGGRGRVHVNVGGFGQEDMGGFSEFFRTFFGGGFGGGGGGGATAGPEGFGGFGNMPGSDLEQTIDLSLEELMNGATRAFRTSDGRVVEVKIPPGLREGSRVRVAKEGAPGPGGKGDLYLRVHVAPHPKFELKDDDLHTSVNVPLTSAVLGGEVEVPTLEGPVGIKIPPETPPGRVFRLRGKGLPRQEAGGSRGDVLATLGVDLPRNLSPREKELFEELRKTGR